MSKFSDRLKRLHTSRVRAAEAAEQAESERASVYHADDVQELETPERTGRRAADAGAGRGDSSAEMSAWEAVGATLEQGWVSFERVHEPSLGHGRFSIADAAAIALPEISREVLGLFATTASLEKAVFLDLETAGLGEGPGNEAWCVGLGWFDDGAFVVRHLLLPHPRDERALLREAARILAEAKLIVSFNGATFDLPRLSSHFARHDIVDPIPGTEHIDLMKVARRLFPGGAVASLKATEERLLGFERRHDVPGAEAPRRWASYLRTLNVRPLLALIEHNRLDIVSLAVLLAYLSELMSGGGRRVDRRKPVEAPETAWASPEVHRRVEASEPSDFRKKLVRSYRLKSKSDGASSTPRRTPRKKPDSARVVGIPEEGRGPAAVTTASEAIGERLAGLRREAARLLQAGEDEVAIPLLHEMVSLSPRNPFPLAELARYYREVGDDDLARLFESRLSDVAPY